MPLSKVNLISYLCKQVKYPNAMIEQTILIAHPETNEQLSALKAVLKALKIKFETSEKSPYDPEFVEKILESQKQARQGNVTRVKKENLKAFLGL
jgi:NH3-dependent NAD+ synthetase